MRLDDRFVAAGGSEVSFCTVKYAPPNTAAPNNNVTNKPDAGSAFGDFKIFAADSRFVHVTDTDRRRSFISAFCQRLRFRSVAVRVRSVFFAQRREVGDQVPEQTGRFLVVFVVLLDWFLAKPRGVLRGDGIVVLASSRRRNFIPRRRRSFRGRRALSKGGGAQLFLLLTAKISSLCD